MAKYTLTIEIEADTESGMWDMLGDASLAAQNSFKGDSWGWRQRGWTVDIEVEDDDEDENESTDD